MNRTALPWLAIALLASLLGGCAAVVVGGAATAGAAHDRRSVGTVIDDQTLEIAAIDHIYTERDRFDGSRIIAVANNGLVLLIGEVFNEALKQRAGERVAELRGARRVVNELAVTEVPGFWRNSADVALTGRVKTALFGIKLPGFDPLRVNVTSRRGEVYLMGLVTEEEADAVVQKVRRMRGVKRVIKVFEYVGHIAWQSPPGDPPTARCVATIDADGEIGARCG